jgi:hypothetical protein
MLTKEELLQKGTSEELADEIVASYPSDDSQKDDDSLTALQKALDKDSPDNMEDLSKAEKKGDEENSDDEKEEYNEKFMKKMKRYMKENKKSFKDMEESKEDMKKAIDDVDTDSEGAVVEMIDLAPFLEKLGPVLEGMAKAIPELSDRIDSISEKTEKNYSLMQKAAKVTAEQAEEINKFLNVPSGRKGVTESAQMQKAQAQASSNEQRKIVHGVLMKAVREKDRKAGQIISAFESSGQNINALKPSDRKYVNDLIQKEAN